MTKFKDELSELKTKTEALAKRADKLKNKNIRDIAKSAIAKLQQTLDHPDIDAASDDEEKEAKERGQAADAGTKPPATPFEAMDPGRSAQAEEARRQQAFGGDKPFPDTVTDGKPAIPGVGAPQPAKTTEPVADPGTTIKHPGDESFQRTDNPNPNDADLNPESGTLRHAPFVAGAADVRKE